MRTSAHSVFLIVDRNITCDEKRGRDFNSYNYNLNPVPATFTNIVILVLILICFKNVAFLLVLS